MSQYTVAVVGVGAVGEEMLRVLKQRRFPAKEIRVLARSARDIQIDGDTYSVQVANLEAFDGVDIALFASADDGSKEFGRSLADRGVTIVDNSNTFRMEPDVPLVVPEVNAHDLENHHGIIANP